MPAPTSFAPVCSLPGQDCAQDMLGGGERYEKTGDRLSLQPRLPLFFRQINLPDFTESTI